MRQLRELKFRHHAALVGVVFILISPFLALVRPESGVLAFGVGMLALCLAASDTPE